MASQADSIALGSNARVAFVVVNWNGRDVLIKCLDSILQIEDPIYRIYVVDNGSSDGSVETMRHDYPQVVVIANERNLGAPIARNQGMRRAVDEGADYVYALDNDLTIDPPAIGRSLAIFGRDPKIAMVGSLIFHEDRPDVIFSAGHLINWTQNLVGTLGQNERFTGQFRDIWDVDYVGSGAVLIRADYIAKHGVFDESYIGYGYEDTEYGYRAKNLGYRVVCCADSRVWHRPHSGVGRYTFRKKYLETRNAIRFIKKYGTFANWCKYLLYVIPGFVYAFFKEGARGNLGGVIGKLRGFIDGLRNYDDLAYELLEDRRKS